jgi:nucleoid-associated protein EbfC
MLKTKDKSSMDFSKMLKQAQEMQGKMAQAKEAMKNISAEGEAAGGAVTVVMNGNHEVISLNIDPETLKEDKNIIEDLIIAATNNAKKAVEVITQEEMSKLTGGIKLPAGFKFPF